ncbi:MAG: ABC transporter substrate-binding protein, partial [Candidatus Binatia bacterium]
LLHLSTPALPAEVPKPGGVLVMGIARDINAMNPLVGTRSTEEHIRNLMFEALLSTDLNGKIQPNLAASWNVSSDGRIYTFQLREGVKFHNGKEMTAEDVKFSIDYTLNPKNGAYGYTDLALVDRCETDGKHRLRIILKKRSVPFLASLTAIPTFSVVPKESLPEGVTRPTQYPPGTGPFKFHEWQPKQRIVLRRHNEYWGQKPYIEQLVLRPVGNDTARINALQARDVDMIERVPYEWVKQMQEGKLPGFSLVHSEAAAYRRLVFNVAAPPFNNKKLRLAVAHALNKKEILQAAYLGFGKTVDQKYPQGHEWHLADLPSPAYDLAKARALVKETGYDGQPIKILVEQSSTRETEELALQAQLKKIGLNIQPQMTDRGAQTTLVLGGEFSLVFRGGDFLPDPVATYATHFSCEPDPKKRRTNFSGYCNKEVDSMFQQLATEADAAKRKSLLRAILTHLSEDVPELPIGFVPRFFALRSHVKGFSTDDNSSFRWSGGGLNFTWLDK